MRFPRWGSAVIVVAGVQVVLSLAAPGFGRTPLLSPVLGGFFYALVLTFAGVGGFLASGGRGDPRALFLGTTYILSASAFAQVILDQVPPTGGGDLVATMRLASTVHVESFLPFFVWGFARHFPRPPARGLEVRLARLGTTVSLWAGVSLLALNLVGATLASDTESLPRLFGLLEPRPAGIYWPVLLSLTVGALASAGWRLGDAGPDARRRIRWLFAGIAVGLAPLILVNVVAWVSPTFFRFVTTPEGLQAVGIVAYPVVLTGPVITAYAVLVHRALEIRLVIRKALRYALTRYALLAVAAAPFLVAVVMLYVNRDSTLAEIVSGRLGLVLGVTFTAGLLGALLSGRLLEWVDRLFFRDQYASQRILRSLADRIREVTDIQDLGRFLTAEVERALHSRPTWLLIADRVRGVMIPTTPGLRPLRVDSGVSDLAARSGRPVRLDWSRPDSVVHTLPLEDSLWLSDAGVRLAVPLLSTSRRIVGLLCLGEKLSELPYTEEDMDLLQAIASSAALAIENRMLLTVGGPSEQAAAGPPPEELEPPARECVDCGALDDGNIVTCEACGGKTHPAGVPLVLAGKYRFLRRIGAGGMGIVYRAVDLALGREVAIKTLPRMSPRDCQRLRSEARAVASISHPSLALIYAEEFYRGVPMLVFEFLPGGDLARRLLTGPLPVGAAVALAGAIADALAFMHERRILHLDVKPSNIGFTTEGGPKLLDFGVSRVLGASSLAETELPEDLDPETLSSVRPGDPSTTITAAGRVIGTPLYMSPEALRGDVPSASFDLWGLSVTLWEALVGENPFMAPTAALVFARIGRGDVPDVREHAPHVSPELARFLSRALSPDIRLRPASAASWKSALDAALRSSRSPAGVHDPAPPVR